MKNPLLKLLIVFVVSVCLVYISIVLFIFGSSAIVAILSALKYPLSIIGGFLGSYIYLKFFDDKK